MNLEYFFNVSSTILLLFFIISKINLIINYKHALLKTFTEFTTYAYILMCISFYYPNNKFLVNLSLCCTFAASIGYWCVIYQLEGCEKKSYFKVILHHAVTLLITLGALFSGHYNVGAWSIYPYIGFCIIISSVILSQLMTRRYLSEPVYGKYAGNLQKKSTHINILLILVSTYIFYAGVHS